MKKWMLRLGPVLSLLVLFGLYLLAKDTLPQAALGLPRTAEDRPIKVEVVKTAVVPAGPSLSQVRDELKLAIGSLPLAAVKDELKAEIAQLGKIWPRRSTSSPKPNRPGRQRQRPRRHRRSSGPAAPARPITW
jgi:hypothetical protein